MFSHFKGVCRECEGKGASDREIGGKLFHRSGLLACSMRVTVRAREQKQMQIS